MIPELKDSRAISTVDYERLDQILFRMIRSKRKSRVYSRVRIDLRGGTRRVHSAPANLHTRTHSVHGSQPEARMVVYMQHLLANVVGPRFLHTRVHWGCALQLYRTRE